MYYYWIGNDIRIILVYRIWLCLFGNTFYVVSKKTNKRSETLNFHHILGINFRLATTLYMPYGKDIYLVSNVQIVGVTWWFVVNSNIFWHNFIEIIFSFETVLN